MFAFPAGLCYRSFEIVSRHTPPSVNAKRAEIHCEESARQERQNHILQPLSELLSVDDLRGEIYIPIIEENNPDITITYDPRPEYCDYQPYIVPVDIKPHSWPNPINIKSRGVLPVAVLGTEFFDVETIDPSSILLVGIESLRSRYEDVAAPVTNPSPGEYNTDGPDGFLDLVLQFDTQEIIAVLGEVNDGDELILTLTGMLQDETEIEGSDIILIRDKSSASDGMKK